MNKDLNERKKMILAMEYIARQTNNEDLFYNIWLYAGVPDGDIPYGSFDNDNVDDYLIEDKPFSDIMRAFLHLMVEAMNDGGLYCGGIVSADTDEL